MATPSSEELLHAATKGEPIHSKDWPRVLDTILERLEDTLQNVFPTPRIPEPDPPPPPLFTLSSSTRPDDEPPNSQASAATDKENAPPRASTATPIARPPVPAFTAASHAGTQPTQTDADMQDSQSPSSAIPIQLLDLFEYIKSTLRSSFAKDPPHTIQRLAELILYPKTHYRFLPSYLRALDRVVCVSSPAKLFPLPAVALPTQGLLNGATAPAAIPAKESLGSDESLGGALLTPIPWLKADRSSFGDSNSESTSPTQSQGGSQGGNELKSEDTEMVDGPNGVGRVETVSVVNGVMVKSSNGSPTKTSSTAGAEGEGSDAQSATKHTVGESLREAGAVTQGELLRLEQEAGVVPVSVASRSPSRNKNAASGSSGSAQSKSYGPGEDAQTDAQQAEAEGTDEEGEKPHARGPDAITDEDIGPQSAASPPGVLDLEKAVGRSLNEAAHTEGETMDTEEVHSEAKEEQGIAGSKTDSEHTIGEPGRSEGQPEDDAAVE